MILGVFVCNIGFGFVLLKFVWRRGGVFVKIM